MLNKSYKREYNSIFKDLLTQFPSGFFDESALPSYTHNNTLMSWLFWKRVDTALSLAGDIQQRSVMDFGCGGGVLFKYFVERNCQITGCDDDAYDLVSEVIKRLDIKADLYNDLFKISGQTFDYIFALDVLEHIEELDRYLEKLLKLSHNSTVLIVSGPTEGAVYKLGRKFAGFSGHYHLGNIYEIESAIKKKGLIRTTMKNLYYPFPLFRVSSWRK
jgi:2-polyprenyl-3-methyl-5-hydroxy-6-metoxy-1,4-benzoquinol methylase